MTEYERIMELRRSWAPHSEVQAQNTLFTDQPELPVQERAVSATIASGVIYQRCGGGRRILRKRVGSN